MDANHWRVLNDSMWSEHIPVQVVSWRMLSRLRNNELLEMMYLDEDTLAWAQATGEGEDDENKVIHRDSNGVILSTGDSVVVEVGSFCAEDESFGATQPTINTDNIKVIKLENTNFFFINKTSHSLLKSIVMFSNV